MIPTPRPTSCDLYRPGHHVHWIHWKVGSGLPDEEHVAVRAVDAGPDGRVRAVLADDSVLEGWLHNPAALTREARGVAGRITYILAHHLLVVRELPIGEGPSPAAYFNLATDRDDLVPCLLRA